MNRPVRTSFLKAHQIIWTQGGWKFLLAPIFLSVALAILLFGLCYLASSAISGSLFPRLSALLELPGWVAGFLTAFVFLLLLAPCYVLFRSLVMVCYGPFLDRISKLAETIVNGSCHEPQTGFIESIQRPLLMAAYSLIGVVLAMLLAFVLGMVPVVGVILSGVFLLPANLFLSSISYLDPYFERRGYSPRQSFGLMWRNRMTVIFFGLIGLLITAIPLLGWFVGPTYSVVAGTVLSLFLHQEGGQKN